MKFITSFSKLLASALIIALFAITSTHFTAFAQGTGSGSTTTEISAEQGIEDRVMDPVKDRAMNIFEKIDAWRNRQAQVWGALKMEKQSQMEYRNEQMDQGLKDRVDRVIETQEQGTIVAGAGDDFDGNILLLRLYISVLGIFVFVFSSKVIFFTLFGVIAIFIISRIINMFRK